MKRGPLFEKAVVEFLRADGFVNAERRVAGGTLDRGDVAGVPQVCLEVKNTGVMQMGVAMAECEKERKNAGARFAAVVFKRRGKPTADAYAIMTLEQFSRWARILEAHGYLR